MKDFDTKWRRLTTLARKAPPPGEAEPPYGFSTRLAARAYLARPAAAPFALFERFALRGLLAAFALSLASAAYSYTSLAGEAEDDLTLAADPLPELLELS